MVADLPLTSSSHSFLSPSFHLICLHFIPYFLFPFITFLCLCLPFAYLQSSAFTSLPYVYFPSPSFPLLTFELLFFFFPPFSWPSILCIPFLSFPSRPFPPFHSLPLPYPTLPYFTLRTIAWYLLNHQQLLRANNLMRTDLFDIGRSIFLGIDLCTDGATPRPLLRRRLRRRWRDLVPVLRCGRYRSSRLGRFCDEILPNKWKYCYKFIRPPNSNYTGSSLKYTSL